MTPIGASATVRSFFGNHLGIPRRFPCGCVGKDDSCRNVAIRPSEGGPAGPQRRAGGDDVVDEQDAGATHPPPGREDGVGVVASRGATGAVEALLLRARIRSRSQQAGRLQPGTAQQQFHGPVAAAPVAGGGCGHRHHRHGRVPGRQAKAALA